MSYKIWAVTYITVTEENGIKTYIKEKVKKQVHKDKYLYETDDLEELRANLISEKKCNKIEFNYDL